MKYATIILAILVSGCSTAPVAYKFPEAPSTLLKQCPPLEKLKDETTLSEVNKTVVRNYTTYYECATNNDGWVEWYQKQKKIADDVQK